LSRILGEAFGAGVDLIVSVGPSAGAAGSPFRTSGEADVAVLREVIFFDGIVSNGLCEIDRPVVGTSTKVEAAFEFEFEIAASGKVLKNDGGA